MQSSLFLKIFLWFWLAMTVVGGALVISGEMTRYRRPIPGPRIGWAVQPAALALRLLVVVMTGGVVCYGLARYLTSPVAKLQKATQQLAKGDLTTRVGSVLEKRGDEFADLGHDFDLMAERIEWLINSQRRLLSDISHELRSPLARLNVALELARKRTGSEAVASLDRIEREAERMNELISELLGLARLDSGAEAMEEKSIVLADLVQEVAADADFEATSQNRRVSVMESEDCVVTGSPELLRSAIENIVRNGLHYTARDTQVEVRLSCSQIHDRDYAVVEVIDQGPGVPEDALEELFRPFYRVWRKRVIASREEAAWVWLLPRGSFVSTGALWRQPTLQRKACGWKSGSLLHLRFQLQAKVIRQTHQVAEDIDDVGG